MVSQYFSSVPLLCVFTPQEKRQANKPCTLSASEGMDAYERSRYILKYTAHIAVLYTFSGPHYFSSSPALFRLHFRSTLQFFFQVAFCIFPSKQKTQWRRGWRLWLINLLKQIFTTFPSCRKGVLWHYRCINQAIWWLPAPLLMLFPWNR